MDQLAMPPLPRLQREQLLEELRAKMMLDLGSMMDAKLQTIQDRLLPARLSKEDVLAAIVRHGKRSAEHVRVGPIRFRGVFGTGAAWVRCPVEAAKCLAEAGRLLVGWSSARVVPLEPRPMHCFRCLEVGHAGLRCPSTTDRSRLCFRCGGEGHMAEACTSDPRCPVCAEAGVAANHMVGGKQCHPPKSRKGMGPSKSSAPPKKSAVPEVVIMDV
ncbi:uncharacterized protein LOC133319458 [Danaus plexippus]|uniref:uncharacterized protein LOC133319458 n=1 Tax=Danaus plexippus TaxID=13037 RepID=UPI002AB2123D|nr:uncharacterized protein LOC133319458 [Danaus plexippus]